MQTVSSHPAPRVLIVEGEVALGSLWQRHLERHGMVVFLVSTQDEATEFLAREARQSPADPGKAIQDLLDAFSTQLQTVMLGLAQSLGGEDLVELIRDLVQRLTPIAETPAKSESDSYSIQVSLRALKWTGAKSENPS